jgi:hypothetical protein
LDRLNKLSPGDPASFSERFKQLSANPKGAAQLKDLLNEAKNSSGASAMGQYADLHESLQRAKQQGGLKGYIGEWLHKYKGKNAVLDKIIELLAPGKYQAVGDIAEKYNIHGAHPHFDEELLKNILKELRGGGDFSFAEDPAGRAFVDSTLKDLHSAGRQGLGIARFLGRNKLPLAAGAAVAAGGAGLYQLVKAIQNQVYSKDKANEWKRTLLQSRGDFDAAKQIQ